MRNGVIVFVGVRGMRFVGVEFNGLRRDVMRMGWDLIRVIDVWVGFLFRVNGEKLVNEWEVDRFVVEGVGVDRDWGR